ncbi:RNA polymerase sigma factor [Promicromonospora sp. NPDC019610]|uniref:RNA polymerase sigma factor n=1 Tax=Promicromonospora sp. NPDC019610 TaxID=3364405 RepID=UPI0037890923
MTAAAELVGADVDPEAGRSDAQIIASSLHEPEDFAAVYGRHARTVHRYAYRRVGPEHAEDVVAETFVAAFRRRATYDLARPDARAWLLGIATREISQLRRAEATRYRAMARVGTARPEDNLADRATTDVAARAAGGALGTALAGLRPGDRDVLLLWAWGDLSYEEIATTLEIKKGTVRSRLHRARRLVRAALPGGLWDVEEDGR